MDWFEHLFGFVESPAAVRENLSLAPDGTLTSRANGHTFAAGRLEIPSLAVLRERAADAQERAQPHNGERAARVRELVGDVRHLLADPANAGALFQVASQFNLLEMVNPRVTPEAGITRYADDPTQGPACAIACAAGTVVRNYFVELDDQIGQSSHRQVDCLADLGAAVSEGIRAASENATASPWTMQNGYALISPAQAAAVDACLAAADESATDRLRGLLRVGTQHDTEVTSSRGRHDGDRDVAPSQGHQVAQIFCSAIPVAYCPDPAAPLERLSRLVLEATYEATLLAAQERRAATGDERVYLTLVGGGVFGNRIGWITDAIERAIGLHGAGLDIAIVSYGRSNAEVRAVLTERGR